MKGAEPTVLVVEDDPDDVFLIQRAFAKAGSTFPVRAVPDGETAIAYLEGHGEYADRSKHPLPALVLLDLKLPGIPGLHVLSWVRKHPTLGRLPVVVLTSSHESLDVNRAYELGANSYLVKPVAFEDLTQLLLSVEHYWLTVNKPPDIEPPPPPGRQV